MRFRIASLYFLLTFRLFAQEQNEPYFIQKAQVQMPLDCYQRNLDEGKSAQQRGDYRLALRYFRDAQGCPEAQKVPDRMLEVKTLITRCESMQAEKKPKADVGAFRPEINSGIEPGRRSSRHFQLSRQFLQYDKPDCFDVTCREAERAFQGGYWDDAASLFRASKNCRDADQADRMAVNQRIEACRLASENELRQKEQEAVRQARHALAANRANDAHILLRSMDRSLAYRLADFANEYIAPDDNDACRQMMFDALYYTPSAHSELADEQLRIPFCYQLGDNLDPDLQVRFVKNWRETKICAFAPSRHQLFQWDAASYEPEEPVTLEDTTMLHFDAVPDGKTLLFFSKNTFLFWRSNRETYRLPVQAVSAYCFNGSGSEFFYLDPNDTCIHRIKLRDVFAIKKGYASRTAADKPVSSKLGSHVMGMAVREDRLWVGYRDSLVVLAPSGQNNPTERERVLTFERPVENASALWLEPKGNAAVVFNDSAAYLFQVPVMGDSTVMHLQSVMPGFPISVSAGAGLTAACRISLQEKDNRLNIYRSGTGHVDFSALLMDEKWDSGPITGCFSPDLGQFATTGSSGKLVVWELADGPNQQLTQLDQRAFVDLNTDGMHLYTWQGDSLWQSELRAPTRPINLTRLPQGDPEFLLAGKNWVAYRIESDSLVLSNQSINLSRVVYSPPGYTDEIVAEFSSNDDFITYLAGDDSVVVRSLEDGRLLAARSFGSTVVQVHIVDGTGEIMVVLLAESDDLTNDRTVVKLWNPYATEETRLRTIRLHSYTTREVALSASKGLIAITDGLDIRVFQQDNLLDEAIRIRQNGTRMITAMDFHPKGDILAAGYDDGSVVFWDMNTGQARFTWAKPVTVADEASPPVLRLQFGNDGRKLHMLMYGGVLLSRDVDLSLVRAGVQTDYKKLVSFSPAQIREYNLEQALEDYPNNFAKLAASGDLPLIRSFFDFYREAAINSNNIKRVGHYCDHASILYSQLDTEGQKVLRLILLEMYEDYHWKLLLRNQTEDAQKVSQLMKRNFNRPAASIIADAHTALLRDDQRTAARLYAEWALMLTAQGSTGVLNPRLLDSLHTKVAQLLEYDLLRPQQLDCLCGLFGQFPAFEGTCADFSPGSSMPLLDAVAQLRWDIFQQLNNAPLTLNHARKIQMLERANADVRLLQRQNPALAEQEHEKIVLVLSEAYDDWGTFENGSNQALLYHQQAVTLLLAEKPFESPAREAARLQQLAENYLKIGVLHFNKQHPAEARQALKSGLESTRRLLEQIGADSLQYRAVSNALLEPLNRYLGMTELCNGDIIAANEAFEQAGSAGTEGISQIYFGHLDLVAGKVDEALKNYEIGIVGEEDMAKALFEIDRLAGQLPARRNQFNWVALRLSMAHPAKTDLTYYYLGELYTRRYSDTQQWDSAVWWSTVMLQAINRIQARESATDNWNNRRPDPKMDQSFFRLFNGGTEPLQAANRNQARESATDIWRNRWLNAKIDESYFRLFNGSTDTAELSKIIRESEQIRQNFKKNTYFYTNLNLLKTNLAHAYWLRQFPGDSQRAIDTYKEYLSTPSPNMDPWELLLKDFRDLAQAGVRWPDLQKLISAIRGSHAAPTANDWQQMGVPNPNE